MESLREQLSQWAKRIRLNTAGFESQRVLSKWLFISVSIGIVAGFGSVLFFMAIEWCTKFFLGRIVGYMPPMPVGEGVPAIAAMARPWLLPLVTAAGGLISGLIVFNLAPEAEGHGTDAAIEAIHKKRARIRPRIPPIKLISAAITIGSGGSGGREGPAAQISAGFGSLMAQWLRLDAQNRRIAVAAGIGAGIGAIFRAPLGGALLSAEILYIHDLEVEALIPGLIASIVGYSIYGAFFGYTPIFGAQPQIGFNQPVQLLYYGLLGVACGLVGVLYARSFYGITALFHRIALPRWFKPAIGGLLVGLMGLALPSCLHTGYGWVQIAMDPSLGTLPLWVILVLPFAKILATSLSIGSGGSGGIFGPGMVIGGMLGASFWQLLHGVLHGMPSTPVSFVIIGMMGMFGGIAHAPLAVMLMVAEMTGNLSLLAPAMIVVAISTAIVGDNTIYRSQLRDRASSPAHRLRFSFPLLSSLSARDAMTPCDTVLSPGTTVAAAESALAGSALGPVLVNPDGTFAGIVTRQALDRVPEQEKTSRRLSTLAHPDPVALDPEDRLDAALERISVRGLSWAPVLEGKRVSGRLTVKDSIAVYRATLEKSIRRATELPGDTVLIEARLDSASPLIGKKLREAGFPRDTLLVSIMRRGDTVFPHADTLLESGDLITAMADPSSERALREFLGEARSSLPAENSSLR